MASNGGGAEQPVDKETAKEHFRSSRLSWSNQAEHVRLLRAFLSNGSKTRRRRD